MKTLLYLRLEPQSAPEPIRGYDRFKEIAYEEGLELETLNYRKVTQDRLDMPHLLAQIEGAHGIWIPHSMLLTHEGVRRAVDTRLQEGAIAFATMTSDPKEGEEYFQELGLESTPIRACAKRRASTIVESYPGLMKFHRHTFPFGFRDAVLFKGVEEILLQQPDGLGCYGEAQPILALPSSEIELLDMRKDLYVNSLPRPEFPVMATAGKEDWRGRIIATTASMIHDAYEGPTGVTFPGIEAVDNRKLARNLVRIISDGISPPGQTWEHAFSLIDEIETKLVRTTEHILASQAGADWFNQLVPDGVREKCVKKAERERAGFPLSAYFDLIDFKTIWRNNWYLFAYLFEPLSSTPSKNGSLKFLQELNEIRKKVAHPVKRHYAGESAPSSAELNRLQQYRDLVKSLTNKAKVTKLPGTARRGPIK